jgi:microcin C transport system substrate-binding protein
MSLRTVQFWLASLGLLTWSSVGIGAHGIAQFGEPKYPAGFSHFEYANPDAPKGGELNLSTVSLNSNFDKYNPFSMKGIAAPGLAELVFETLAVHSFDELNVQYGLLAEDIDVATDFSAATFRLHGSARFSNGDPVTAQDVVHSFNTLVGPKASPRFKSYFVDVARLVVVDSRTVRFEFKRRGRDLAFIAGSLPVFSPKWGERSDGTKLEFDKIQLDAPVATGPYLVSRSPSGRNAIYTRNPNYWGKDIAVRKGSFNFDRVVYKLYKDIDTQVAAIRAGDFDFLSETKMRYWCCQYIGDRFDGGELIKELFPHKNPRPMNGYIFNLRRQQFQDVRVRRAFGYAYDWEWLNAMIFDNEFERQESYFANTTLAAKGEPTAEEVLLLEPFRASLEPAVFGPMLELPTTAPPHSYRENLRMAAKLFAEAGWVNRGDGVLRNAAGEPFVLRVSGTPSLLEAFYLNIKRLGIVVEFRNNDPSIDRENLRNFNFDFTSIALREARAPGPELLRSFHSKDAATKGSENLLGLSSPVVDNLIEHILNANSQAELETAAHAFDRVMMHHAYVLPWRYLENHYTIRHRRLKRPEKLPEYYGAQEWVLGQWWDGSLE